MTTKECIPTKKEGKTMNVIVYTQEDLSQECAKPNHKSRIYRFYTRNDRGNVICKEFLPRDDGTLRPTETALKNPWKFVRILKEILTNPTMKQDIAIYRNTENGRELRFHRIFILNKGSPTKQTSKGEAIPDRKYPIPDDVDIIL